MLRLAEVRRSAFAFPPQPTYRMRDASLRRFVQRSHFSSLNRPRKCPLWWYNMPEILIALCHMARTVGGIEIAGDVQPILACEVVVKRRIAGALSFVPVILSAGAYLTTPSFANESRQDDRLTTSSAESTITEVQSLAAASLQSRLGGPTILHWGDGGLKVLEGFSYSTGNTDVHQLLTAFLDTNWTDLAQVLNVSESDSFDLRTIENGPKSRPGLRIRFDRRFDGIPVRDNFFVVEFLHGSSGDDARVKPSSARDPLRVVRIRSNMAPLERFTATDNCLYPEDVAVDLLRLNSTVPIGSLHLATLEFDAVNGLMQPVWRLWLQDDWQEGNERRLLEFTMSCDGTILRGPMGAVEAPRKVQVRTHATPHHTSFDSTGTKTSVPLPNGSVFFMTSTTRPCYGTFPHTLSDYHGTFLANIFDVPWSPVVPCPHDPGATCPGQDCLVLDYRGDAGLPDNYRTELLSTNEANTTYLIDGLLSAPPPPATTVYQLPWRPVLGPTEQCNGCPLNSPGYDQAITMTNLGGVRGELSYHLERAKHLLADYPAVPFLDLHEYLRFQRPEGISTDVSTRCIGASQYVGVANELLLQCPYCISDLSLHNDDELRENRNTVNHEVSHATDMSAHSGLLSSTFGGDLPRCDNWYHNGQNWLSCCHSEGIAQYGAIFASYFESFQNVPAFGQTFPKNYHCGYLLDGPDGTPCNPYARGGLVFTSPLIETLLAAGPLAAIGAFRTLEHLNPSTRILDPACANSWDPADCSPAVATYYEEMALESRGAAFYTTQYSTAEVSRAWHLTIDDAAPGTIQCGLTCTAVNTTDPAKDYFPWYDDVTNVPASGPMIFTERRIGGYTHSAAFTHFGVLEYWPGSCFEDRNGATQCKRLAMDYLDDVDVFTFLGREGETYQIWTDVSSSGFATDTLMLLMDVDGMPLFQHINDDCSDATIPHSEKSSCVTITPPSTAIYRIVVMPGSASEVGAGATYGLNVRMVGDDFPDTLAAGPAPLTPDEVVRGFINSSDDVDWFSMMTQAPSGSGQNVVSVRVYSGSGISVNACLRSAGGIPWSCDTGTDFVLSESLPSGTQIAMTLSVEAASGSSPPTAYYVHPQALAQMPTVSLGRLGANLPLVLGSAATPEGKEFTFTLELGQHANIEVFGTSDVELELGGPCNAIHATTGSFFAPARSCYLLTADSHGGLSQWPYAFRSVPSWENQARIAFVAPWGGTYRARITANGGFVIFVSDLGSEIDNYPGEP